MSIKFLGYMFPKRQLWHVTTTVRSYLAATHRYAYVTQMLACAEHRARQRPDDQHAPQCGTNYLGQCTCARDGFGSMRKVREWVTDKDPELFGVEGMVVDFKRRGEYLMVLRGEYWWNGLDDGLVEYLGLREVHYNDQTDVPDKDRPNLPLVEHHFECVRKGRYFLLPLLTTHDLSIMYWTMATNFARMDRARKAAT